MEVFHMRKRVNLTTKVSAIFAATMFLVNAAHAQSRDQYVISAKAGGINYISGDVLLKRRGETRWQSVTTQDDLVDGDVLQSGANGRVEMLLNPGSYLRVAENSEFELTSTSLDILQLKLFKGSFIVEVAGADEARTLIDVGTPQGKVGIDRKGLYRINVLPNTGTEVLVRKGRVSVGGNSSLTTEVKEGKTILISGDTQLVTKLNSKEQDAFDLWSEQRAETVIAANRKLSDRTIANSYTNYRSNVLGRRGYGSSWGFWVYDPFARGRTFLPFYSGWSSPYGRGYSHGFGFPWHGHAYFSPFGISQRSIDRSGIGIGIGNRRLARPGTISPGIHRRVPSIRHGRIHH